MAPESPYIIYWFWHRILSDIDWIIKDLIDLICLEVKTY